MWWEVMPSLLIIGTALSTPQLFIYYTNKLVLNNPYKRLVVTGDEAHCYLRDMRITGDPYVQNGLDCLEPDNYVEPEKTQEKKPDCP